MSKTLGEIFEGLSYGVLSNMSVGGEGSGTIPAQHQPKLLKCVNDALVILCSRFTIFQKELTIRALETRTLYPLKQIHADQHPGTATKFIVDSATDPFLEDVLTVLSVFDEDGCEVYVNDRGQTGSLFTPDIKTVQINDPVDGDFYFVIYQARHAKLLSDDLSQIIRLPDVLYPALEHYVSYLVLSPMNGPEHSSKASECYAMYDLICTQAENKSHANSSTITTSHKLTDRGFV